MNFTYLQNNSDWFNHSLDDGGPLYSETDLSRWIVEPWNAATSILMMLPAVFWLIKSIRHSSNNYFFYFCLALVFMGGLGSALFHAFRISKIFLMLDIIPSAVLTLSLSIWFWLKLFKSKWTLVVFIFAVVLLRFLLFGFLPQHQAINLSYLLSGIAILLPLCLFLFQTHWAGILNVMLTVLFFTVALLFRETDTIRLNWLPIGTHFLWHVFSAAGSFFMMKYLYETVTAGRMILHKS